MRDRLVRCSLAFLLLLIASPAAAADVTPSIALGRVGENEVPDRAGHSPRLSAVPAEPSAGAKARAYEKGDRTKHVGKGAEACIQYVPGQPKKWIGMCPAGVSNDVAQSVLANAIAGSNGDRDVDFPKKLYAVYKGTIYEAQTTTRGRSYHAYPYRGKLAKALVEALGKFADDEGTKDRFDAWVNENITFHGSWAT